MVVVQVEDCKGRNALAPPKREPVGRAIKKNEFLGDLYIFGQVV